MIQSNRIKKAASRPAEAILAVVETHDATRRGQEAVKAAIVKQLSLFDAGACWSDNERALPNEYARTALFTARSKNIKRELIENKVLYSVNSDIVITYTGSELRSYDDQLVWQQIIDFAKRQPIGHPVSFTFIEMARNLGVSLGGTGYKLIKDCIARLATVVMMFRSERQGSIDSLRLIKNFCIRNEGKSSCHCEVEIPAETILLFAGDHYIRVAWEAYRDLSPIARRLYDYASSHRKPFPLPLTSFHGLCASTQAVGKYWTRAVRGACEELVSKGLLSMAYVDDGKIHCLRKGNSYTKTNA